MGYCLSVEGNVVHVCELSDGKSLKSLKCLMFIPSGPVELLFVLFEMTNCVCVVVSRIFSVARAFIEWYMCLLILFVLYGVTFVNCLFKTFALSMPAVVVLVSKGMRLFCFVGGFLLNGFAMVPHMECRLCL